MTPAPGQIWTIASLTHRTRHEFRVLAVRGETVEVLYTKSGKTGTIATRTLVMGRRTARLEDVKRVRSGKRRLTHRIAMVASVARRELASGRSLAEVASSMGLTSETVRAYLRETGDVTR
jgi:hypothetical protein